MILPQTAFIIFGVAAGLCGTAFIVGLVMIAVMEGRRIYGMRVVSAASLAFFLVTMGLTFVTKMPGPAEASPWMLPPPTADS